jgi:hypothetical protein
MHRIWRCLGSIDDRLGRGAGASRSGDHCFYALPNVDGSPERKKQELLTGHGKGDGVPRGQKVLTIPTSL